MKFSEHWLRTWTNPEADTAALTEALTMAGLEVDAVEPAAPPFSGVVVGRVIRVEPHPNADKLRLTRVDVGRGEPLQIVCGAANVAPGILVPTALVGAVLPGGLKIKKAKLRGVESLGMLCSAKELGLADEADGLMILPEDAPVGEDLRRYLDLDDCVIDIDLTPNRGDCLSIRGLAREVGVIFRSAVREPAMDPVPPVCDEAPAVDVRARDACPRYLARAVLGIDPQARTPLWMVERLRRGGIRAIHPVVDVTNYVLLELGQPMHAFDRAKLHGTIQVRHARPGEVLTLLDGRELTLDEDFLVIADDQAPLALAGIMGGADSGVGPHTTDIVLESAFFAPAAIRGRARRLGLQTDSSYRFERGVDPALQRQAMERATALLLDIAGGRPGPIVEVVDEAHLPARAPIGLRRERVEALLGLPIDDATIEDILTRLGLHPERRPDGWQTTPPSHRFDLAIEADLIEEIGRIYGYHRLPEKQPHARLDMAPRPEGRLGMHRLRAALVDLGYHEAITYSFVEESEARLLEPDAELLRLANPISSEMSVMRPNLWPGLLRALRHNLNRQQTRVRLFETGLCFARTNQGIQQTPRLGGVVLGEAWPEQWGLPREAADFFHVKGDVETLLGLTHREGNFIFDRSHHPALHPGQAADILDGRRTVGRVGVIHPRLAAELDVPASVILFELDLTALEQGRIPQYRPLSRYPAIRRDLALLVDEGTPAQAVLDALFALGVETLKEARLFDVYAGEGLPEGKKSLAIGLRFQHPERTLSDEEIEQTVTRITQHLAERLGATLRS